MFYYACAFFLTSYFINKYKYDIADYMLYHYAKCKRIKRSTNYDVTYCKLYNDSGNLILETDKPIKYNEAAEKYNDLSYIEISYTFLGKQFKIYYNGEYNFPPYPNMIKLKDGYKYKFLSCIYNEENNTESDVTTQVNELLGPKNNFYNDLNIKMKTSYLTKYPIQCMDNDVNSFVLGDYFKIYKESLHED